MNERIQALIEQCKHTSTTYFDGRGNVTETYFDKEKFAELIVRQCGFELVDESLQYNSPLIQEFTVKVANRIKARFGMNK